MTVFALPAQVTMSNAAQVWAAVQQALQTAASPAEQDLTLDLSALVALDSSVIALMLQTVRGARARGQVVRMRQAPQRLLDLARLYGVESLLPEGV